jgi:glycosidase
MEELMTTGFETPEWVHHAVIYQIFPDRFAKSSRVPKPTNLEPWDSPPSVLGYKGGDLLGVLEHLDYLQDLGITTIYFTPVFQSASNHRYHTHDYLKVDPLLGGDAALRNLLDEAHRRGIRIVLDGVFNHASRGFFQFNDILENGEKSPYLDWFDIRGFPLNAYHGHANYRCWWALPALPEFNHRNPQVRQFIFHVARYWLEQGIDGWRLDVPFCIDDDSFWQEFRQVVKTANPQAYITGEIPDNATRWLRGDQFDGVMNYLFNYSVLSYIGGSDLDRSIVGDWLKKAPEMVCTDVQQFAAALLRLLQMYPRPAVLAQLNLLDSHDTARALSLFSGRKDLLRLAALLLLTYPGAPSIYYGDEIGLSGGMDPGCRAAFPWDASAWDHELRGYFRELVHLRRAHPALRTGKFRILSAQDDCLVYLRSLENENLVVALNRSASTHHINVEVPGLLPDGLELTNRLGSGRLFVHGGRLAGAYIPPYSGAVWA